MGYAGRAWLAVSLPAAVALAACFIDNPGAAPPAGTSSTTGSGGHDTTTSTTSTASDGGSEGGDGGADSMCTRNGGYGNIEAVVADLMTKLSADCSISAFFAALPPDARLHLTDCMTKQLAVLTHCPGIAYDVDSNGVACRDMKTSHHGLAIRSGDFGAFLGDLDMSFQSAGYPKPDRDALLVPLGFYSTDIVTNSAPGFDKSICDGGDGG